jgi:CxxH/CxxC protein (TIGR04129 family)
MDEKKIIFACEEHIEIALDDFVNLEEKAPQMIKLSELENKKCNYCNNKSEYELLH